MILGIVASSINKIITSYPVYKDSGSVTSAAGVADRNVAYPATVNEDDILLIVMLDAEADTFTTPAGWASVHAQSDNANLSVALFWKRAVGTETGTVTVTSASAATGVIAGVMHRFSGCVTSGTPYEEKISNVVALDAGQSLSNNSALGNSRLGIVITLVADNPTITDNSTGYTEGFLFKGSAGTAFSTILSWEEIANSSYSDGTVNYTWVSDYSTQIGFMLLPTGTFDPDYQAILDRADVQVYTKPSAAQQIIQNQLLIDLKSNGIWAENDVIYIPANDGSEDFGKLNWKTPASHELTKIGTVTWTSNKGFRGNGTTGVMNTNWQYSDAVKFTQTAASASIYCSIEANPTTFETLFAGTLDTGDDYTRLWDNANDYIYYKVNDASAQSTPHTSYTDNVMTILRDSGSKEFYINGVNVESDTYFPGVPSSADWYIGGRNNNGTADDFSDIQWGFFSTGSGLEVKQVALNTLIKDYMTDINA